jgi:hypothetical protein
MDRLWIEQLISHRRPFGYSPAMFGDGSLAMREFAMKEPLPLATIHDAVLDFLPNRDDAEIRVPLPETLIAQKVISVTARAGQPKAGTDSRDLRMLLLAYPQLKTELGPVMNSLVAAGATPAAINEWSILVGSAIEPENDDDGF